MVAVVVAAAAAAETMKLKEVVFGVLGYEGEGAKADTSWFFYYLFIYYLFIYWKLNVNPSTETKKAQKPWPSTLRTPLSLLSLSTPVKGSCRRLHCCTEEETMPSERSPNRHRSEVEDKDRDQKHRRRLQDALPLESPRVSDGKVEVNAGHASNRKANEIGETTKNSNPAAVPRPRSYFQHDDRGTASQDGRRSGRRVTSDRGWWKDSKDDEDRVNRKVASSDIREKEGKSGARCGDRDNHVWRHDKFSEVEGDSNPPAKKRRQFREEKLAIKSDPTENTASEPIKAAHPIGSAGGSDRRQERSRDRRPLERREHDRGHQRERSFPNRRAVEKTGFPSPRDRFNAGDNGVRYRGRDRFDGRQGYRSTGTGGRVEKWKHDLFNEANRSPSPKTEEDPVAKVEALLAS